MACTLSTISNHTSGFDFEQLFTVYLYLNSTCPPESDIFFHGSRLLTNAVCRKVTGTSNTNVWTEGARYPLADMWNRIVTWKLPLFQLVAQFPRPPLGGYVETATMMHLLGDPIDSMACLMLTLGLCKSRAKLAKRLCSETGSGSRYVADSAEYDRSWKALAIIMISYDTCGRADKVEEFCRDYRDLRRQLNVRHELRKLYDEAGYSLAADRSTKTLPVVFAQVIFIGGWMIALVKASSSDPSPTNWANVEVQSVAISAMYLWVTSAVAIGSFIGTSQTEGSIPRILRDFELHLGEIRNKCLKEQASEYTRLSAAVERRPPLGEELGRPLSVDLGESTVEVEQPETIKRVLTTVIEMGQTSAARQPGIERALNGGVLSWRPTKWKYKPVEHGIGTWSLAAYTLVAILFVGMGYATAAILSSLPPPRGLSCRHITETLMFTMWLSSFVIEYILEKWQPTWIFWAVFWKDMFFGLGNIAIILAVQWGVMNSCSCWSMWGLTGLHLPQMPEVKPELMHMVKDIAPWWVASAVVLQLALCVAVLWYYTDAVRVFIQRDDGLSNWPEWAVSLFASTRRLRDKLW